MGHQRVPRCYSDSFKGLVPTGVLHVHLQCTLRHPRVCFLHRVSDGTRQLCCTAECGTWIDVRWGAFLYIGLQKRKYILLPCISRMPVIVWFSSAGPVLLLLAVVDPISTAKRSLPTATRQGSPVWSGKGYRRVFSIWHRSYSQCSREFLVLASVAIYLFGCAWLLQALYMCMFLSAQQLCHVVSVSHRFMPLSVPPCRHYQYAGSSSADWTGCRKGDSRGGRLHPCLAYCM
jgi:hypothetical protein